MRCLELEDVHTFYGLSHILFGVSLFIDTGETICLLGRNGVGKTTVLRSIMGLTRPSSGRIEFKGEDIMRKSTHYVARRGIGYVPEDRRIFPNLTVHGNLDVAQKTSEEGRKQWDLESVYEVFPILRERASQYGGSLSGGEQQMLTIARSLMGNPTLLLIDEPTEGLAPLIVKIIMQILIKLQNQGQTLFVVEQNSDFVLEVSHRAYIQEKGKICYTGKCAELKEDKEILKRFLTV